QEVARQLQCREGTLSSRLATARKMLARRLARHGLSLSGGAMALSQDAASAGVPRLLVVSTVRAATLVAVGTVAAGGAISSKVAAVTEGVLKAMFATKLKVLGALVLALCIVGSSGAVFLHNAVGSDSAPKALAQNPAAPDPAGKKAREEASPSAAANDLEGLWADLASPDELKAGRAIAIMTASPQESLPFLKKNLKRVKADPKRTAELIADLDNDDFGTRSKAVDELEYLGKYVREDLKKALSGKPSAEARRRIEQLLA